MEKENNQHNQDLGKLGEEIAVQFLEEKGWLILDRNYSFMRNELDIVASTDREIVFVEVKTRSSTFFGEPEDAVTDAKQKSIFKVADAWLHERRLDGAPVRFDVISIQKANSEKPEINHIEAAFW